MTVCTASIFNWSYGENDYGSAIAIASDRMYSDEGLGIEYESSRTKVAHLDSNRVVLVSGDLASNSRALNAILLWTQQNPGATTAQIADTYGQIVAALSFERAAKLVLNPLGIFTDEVISDELGLKKYGLPDALVMNLAEQLQSESLPSEAIIAGCEDRTAWLYRIDGKGRVSLHNDIGFVSIGNGGVHSSAYFMQMPYHHVVFFAGALVSTFFAKKRSEIAPGVGATTDMSVINAHGTFQITPDDMATLERIHRDDKKRAAKLSRAQADKFSQAMQKRNAVVETAKVEEVPSASDTPSAE